MDWAANLEASSSPQSLTRRRRERRRRTLAASISVIVHLLIVVFFMTSLKGHGAPPAGANGDDADAIIVTLAGRTGAPPTRSAPTPSQLDVLFRKIRSEQSPLVVASKADPSPAALSKLFDVIDDQKPAKDAPVGTGKSALDQGGQGSTANGPKTANEKVARGQTHPTGGTGGSGSSAGGLWGQIKPCWDRLPNVSSVPVSLEIVLSDRGQIAVPPKIIRPDSGAPDERRLISEARALAAVTACMPYHGSLLADAQRVFRVDFAAK
jgi:hypothetical protein